MFTALALPHATSLSLLQQILLRVTTTSLDHPPSSITAPLVDTTNGRTFSHPCRPHLYGMSCVGLGSRAAAARSEKPRDSPLPLPAPPSPPSTPVPPYCTTWWSSTRV
eukprot:107761-Chlamydomonas_euryale.AAC.4